VASEVHDASPGPDIACADLTTFCRLGELGLEVTGQRLDPDRAVLACRVVEPDQRCRRCDDDAHVGVEATWGIYQRIIAAYREPDRRGDASSWRS
jgi:hypothetical protein